jgi:hypothetical protein
MQNYRSGIRSGRLSNRRSSHAILWLACGAFFISCCTAARANTLHVPSEFPTIQSALNAAASGDSILVAQGIYMENLVWPQVSDLHLLSDPANVTRPTIDGGSAGRVVDIEAEGNTVFTAEISGFVITHGFLDVPAHTGETGAGIFMNNGVLQLSKCVIRENVITSSFAIQNNGGGAGVSIVGTPAGSQNVIQNCAFLFNTVLAVTSGDGAAIHLDGAPALIRRTEVKGNRISVGEVALGTIYGFASDLSLESVKIEENSAQTSVSLLVGFAAIKGAAVFSYLSNLDILNCKIANNSSTPQNSTLAVLGAAVYFYGEGTTLKVSSSSIAYNKRTDAAPVAGAAIFFSSLSPRTATVVNSILWNPSDGDEVDSFSRPARIGFSDVRDGTTDRNNLNADPLFASQVDLHLQAGSPCLDAGNDSSAPSRDIDGNPRPLPAGSNVDLGCYEME